MEQSFSKPIEGKSIIRFHVLPWETSNYIHVFRSLRAAYGAFRIVVRRLQVNSGSRLFLQSFFQVYEIDDSP